MNLTIGWLYGTKMKSTATAATCWRWRSAARWRGIDAEVRRDRDGRPDPADVDIFFFGGGQDRSRSRFRGISRGAKGEAIKAAVDDGAALLSVCGGYQLLGHEYRPHAAERCPGSACSTSSPRPGRSGSSATS